MNSIQVPRFDNAQFPSSQQDNQKVKFWPKTRVDACLFSSIGEDLSSVADLDVKEVTMGVPKFYRWISERYPCLSQVIKEHQVRILEVGSRHQNEACGDR